MNNNELEIIELISRLKELGVVLRAEGDILRIDAPKGALGALLREELSQRKQEILKLLTTEASGKNHEILPLQKAPRERSLCTSFSQERLWFLSQLEPESIAYNISLGVKLPRLQQADILKKSLDEIFRRHEILRTTFGEEEGTPVQIVSSAAVCDVQLVNLQEVPESQHTERAQQIVAHQTLRPFDLSTGPLCRATLIQFGKEEIFLIITMHHIITDRWSLGILAQEIRSLCSAYSENRPSQLPELPIQYADFAYSQRKWLDGDVLESQLTYWKQKLSGDLQILQLPTDRPRPAVQTYRGAKKSFVLSKCLTDKILRLCQSQRITLFMALLAAFQVLLHRYTGQTDFAIGSPIANRNRTEVEGLIGFFVNMLVMRTDLSGDPRFLDLLVKVKETVLEALSNQDTPFEKIVEVVNPKRDMSYSPLFQVMLTFQNVPRSSTDLLGWSFFDTGASMFDLTLYLWEEKKGLAGEIEYSTDLFDAETIERLTGHFEALLESIASNPEQRLSELTILPESERHRLLEAWNDTAADYPKEKCLNQLFEDQAARTPENIAVVCEGKSLTFSELNSRANQVANHLRGLGVQADAIVGIYIDRSIEMVVGLIGILKSGAAYTPLDPNFPQDRVEFMIEDSGSRIVITQSHLRKNIRGFSGKIISIDSDWEIISKEDNTSPKTLVDSSSLAYVIYTSGSTGKPKGVQISHQALINFLHSMQKKPGLSGADTVLSVTTISFDIFGLELFLPLITGAKVVLVKWEDAADGVRLMKSISESGATVMQATPATWRLLLMAGWQGNRSLKILCGGEALPHDLVDPLLERCKEFWNLYGPTETTIWSTAYQIKSKEDTVLIGSPIANTQIYILDKSLQPVPVGVSGELYIGGDGLARGYLNRPELTAEKFIPHPFSKDRNARIYQTGDLARWRHDGTIECLGRTDFQIKIRGFRVEIGEIETLLNRHPSIKQSAVIVRSDPVVGNQLMAYIVPRNDSGSSVPDLKQYLREALPEYMVPSRFSFLATLPLTPNGKINRKALPAISDQREADSIISFEAANDALEMQLIKIWESVLGVKPIGIKDNFFDIGGHSLIAARLFSKINKIMGLNLSLATLFKAPTVDLLSKTIRDKDWSAGWSSLVPIQPGGSRPPLYFVHGAGGNVLLYRELSAHLGSDQPFYGFQAQGVDGNKEPQRRFEEMAAHYIREMRLLQPDGPYYLGGYCLGGAIALEMAQQLQEQGQKVAMIAMIETYNFRSKMDCLPYYYYLFQVHKFQNLKFHWDNLWGLNMREQMMFFSKKSRVSIGRMKTRLFMAFSRIAQKIRLPIAETYPHMDLTKINDRANLEYFPKPYNGKITLFRPEKHFAGYNEPDFGWGKIALEGVDVHTFAVNPRGILVEPFVKDLAKELKRCIDKWGRYSVNLLSVVISFSSCFI